MFACCKVLAYDLSNAIAVEEETAMMAVPTERQSICVAADRREEQARRYLCKKKTMCKWKLDPYNPNR